MIGLDHCWVARECRGNAKLLLAIVQIDDGVPRFRANESAQPNRGSHNVFTAAWLVAAGARSEWPQAGAVASVGTDCEAVDAHFSQHLAELVDRRNGGVDPRPLAKRVLVHCEPVATEIVCRQPRPWNTVIFGPSLPAISLQRQPVEDATIIRIDLLNQIESDTIPVHAQPRQCLRVGGYAGAFNMRRRYHIASPQ